MVGRLVATHLKNVKSPLREKERCYRADNKEIAKRIAFLFAKLLHFVDTFGGVIYMAGFPFPSDL